MPPPISPSLLAKRPAELVDDGVVLSNGAPPRSKSVEYHLTDAVRSLEPVIVETIRSRTRWMLLSPGEDRIDQKWAPLGLRALLDGRPAGRGRLHLDIDGVQVTVSGSNGRRRVTTGHHGRPDANVAAPLPALLAVAAGAMTLDASGAAVSGDRPVSRA
jgi:hypothetical protein